MSFLFSTALSGLRASSDALSVTGNNIANANTTAFKSQTINFADVILNTLGVNGANAALQLGNGVTVASINKNFSQGNIDDSGSLTSMAIHGNGFFVVKDADGKQNYTRAGDFILDKDGFLVTSNGHRVQGYAAVDGVIPPDAGLSALQVPIGATVNPKITTEATMRMNLNSGDAVGTDFTASVQVYDSLGGGHALNLVYTKTADLTYTVKATLDGTDAPIAPSDLTFDADGKLTSPASPGQLVISPDQTTLGGATLPTININLYQPDGTTNLTNLAAASGVSSTSQDGFAAGTVTGLLTDKTGVLTAVFTNGQTRPLGQIALATFNSQDGLKAEGGNLYGEWIGSGPPSIGRPGAAGRGEIAGQALEQSNVDIAKEFTNLIIAQRSYQANSRVITTFNQALQDLLQVI